MDQLHTAVLITIITSYTLPITAEPYLANITPEFQAETNRIGLTYFVNVNSPREYKYDVLNEVQVIVEEKVSSSFFRERVIKIGKSMSNYPMRIYYGEGGQAKSRLEMKNLTVKALDTKTRFEFKSNLNDSELYYEFTPGELDIIQKKKIDIQNLISKKDLELNIGYVGCHILIPCELRGNIDTIERNLQIVIKGELLRDEIFINMRTRLDWEKFRVSKEHPIELAKVTLSSIGSDSSTIVDYANSKTECILKDSVSTFGFETTLYVQKDTVPVVG